MSWSTTVSKRIDGLYVSIWLVPVPGSMTKPKKAEPKKAVLRLALWTFWMN